MGMQLLAELLLALLWVWALSSLGAETTTIRTSAPAAPGGAQEASDAARPAGCETLLVR